MTDDEKQSVFDTWLAAATVYAKRGMPEEEQAELQRLWTLVQQLGYTPSACLAALEGKMREGGE
jgi:hypothetical protein